jgi:glycosyltransferase involved in cell wall biosynthesis
VAAPVLQPAGGAMTEKEWRVLVAAPFPPRLDGRHGGSRALAQLLARAATRHRIGLIVLRGHDEPGVDDLLRKACDFVEEFEIPPVRRSFSARLMNRIRLDLALLRGTPTWAAERNSSGFATRLQELVRTWRPDVVQLEYRIMGQFLPAVVGLAPTLVVDLDPDAFEGSRLLAPFEARAWKSLGRAVCRQADALVALTERDRKALSWLNGSTFIARIPLGYELPDQPLDPAGTDPHGIVWVGSFIHPPNIDAANWLARDIFPRVKARMPDASLHLVGSHAPSSLRALNGDGVTISTEVPDVRPYLNAAAVVASPIRMGGGMRVKVLEALANGKAIVASPLAVEGLDLENGRQVVVAKSDAEFVDALVELLGDPERRTAIAKAGRRWAEQYLDLEPQVHAYEALYASLVESSTGWGRAASGTSGR